MTRAPITPRDVKRRYSKGRVFEVVFRKGYRKSGMWATSGELGEPGVERRGTDIPFKKS